MSTLFSGSMRKVTLKHFEDSRALLRCGLMETTVFGREGKLSNPEMTIQNPDLENQLLTTEAFP